LSHASSSCCSGYFWDGLSYFVHAGLNLYPSILSFLPLLGWQACAILPSFYWLRWGLLNWPIIMIFPISTSQVARITDVNHWTQLSTYSYVICLKSRGHRGRLPAPVASESSGVTCPVENPVKNEDSFSEKMVDAQNFMHNVSGS
jgi:hypothetical protein